jgi:hypothetical protein
MLDPPLELYRVIVESVRNEDIKNLRLPFSTVSTSFNREAERIVFLNIYPFKYVRVARGLHDARKRDTRLSQDLTSTRESPLSVP